MKYKKRMRPKWRNIHKLQDSLDRKFKNRDKAFRDRLKMVAGELLENSVKYYMAKSIKKSIEFKVECNRELIISIVNQRIYSEDLCFLNSNIDKINSSESPYNLFIDRLQEIMDNRKVGESRLGLLRIASEGGFKLSCNYVRDRVSIYARKALESVGGLMEPLLYEDLKIDISEEDDHIRISWKGKCRTLNPEHTLDTYLAKLTKSVRGKRLVVFFDELESMNSSTVPPLLTFIKSLDEDGTESLFLYDDNEDWQRASFKPLAVIAGKYRYITIKPVSNFDV